MPATETTTDGAAFDGAGLEQALAEHRFDQPATGHLVGMVRPSQRKGHVSFAPSGCESWVEVPSAMIDEAEHLGERTCRDHSHPVFRLSLREPADPQAKVLMELLTARAPLPSTLPAMVPPEIADALAAGPHGRSVGAMRARCQSWCHGSTLICACPVYVPGYGTGYVVYACGTCIDPVAGGGVFTA